MNSNNITADEVKRLNFSDVRVRDAVFSGNYGLAKQLSGLTVSSSVPHRPASFPSLPPAQPAVIRSQPASFPPSYVPSSPRPLSPRSVTFSAPLQIPSGSAYSPRGPGTMYPTSPRGATGQYAEVMTPTSPRSILRGRSSYESPYYPRSPRSPRSPTSTVYNNAY